MKNFCKRVLVVLLTLGAVGMVAEAAGSRIEVCGITVRDKVKTVPNVQTIPFGYTSIIEFLP